MPVTVAVPALVAARKMLPEAGTLPPSVAWTWMLLIVMLLIWPTPLAVMFRVTFVAVTEILLTKSSLPPEPETLLEVAEPTPGLNCQPAGAVRMRGVLLWTGKSLLACSRMTMLPRVVKAGVATLAALSAEMLVPPVPAVTGLALTVWVKLAEVLLLKPVSPLYTAVTVGVVWESHECGGV